MTDRRFIVVGDPARVHVGEPVGVDVSVPMLRPFLNVNSGEVHVGSYAMFGYGVKVLTGTHDYTRKDAARFPFPSTGRDVRIGRGAWLASGVTVCGPVTIGDHAVVGAGSVVTRDVPPGELWAGVPARFVKRIDFQPGAANVLLLVPIKPALHPDLKRKARELAERLPEANPGVTFETVVEESDAPDVGSRQARIAAVRNDMLARHLRDHHTHVLWADADLIDYAPEIVGTLLDRCDGGMVAPVCIMEHHGNWAYDTHGFAKDGRPSSANFSEWREAGPVHDLDSVGVFVLIDADIYRAGARHAEQAGLTEWFSVGQFAKGMGRPVRVYSDVTVTHAHLPAYGEGWH